MTPWRNAKGFFKGHLFHLCVCVQKSLTLALFYFFAFGGEECRENSAKARSGKEGLVRKRQLQT